MNLAISTLIFAWSLCGAPVVDCESGSALWSQSDSAFVGGAFSELDYLHQRNTLARYGIRVYGPAGSITKGLMLPAHDEARARKILDRDMKQFPWHYAAVQSYPEPSGEVIEVYRRLRPGVEDTLGDEPFRRGAVRALLRVLASFGWEKEFVVLERIRIVPRPYRDEKGAVRPAYRMYAWLLFGMTGERRDWPVDVWDGGRRSSYWSE